jgi:hypothetical protein
VVIGTKPLRILSARDVRPASLSSELQQFVGVASWHEDLAAS